MRIDGACHCGNIAFEAEVDPRNCTGSVIIPIARHSAGRCSGRTFRRPGETFEAGAGHAENLCQNCRQWDEAAQAFCSDCGTGLWATSPENPTSYGLRVGTITQRATFRPTHQIWCQSELPWTSEVGAVERRARA